MTKPKVTNRKKLVAFGLYTLLIRWDHTPDNRKQIPIGQYAQKQYDDFGHYKHDI